MQAPLDMQTGEHAPTAASMNWPEERVNLLAGGPGALNWVDIETRERISLRHV
jgi:hypothetical protein